MKTRGRWEENSRFPVQILSSVQSLSIHPNSRVGKENFEALCRIWQDQMNDFSMLVKEIQDQIEGRGEKNVYLSLPRPGKQNTTSKGQSVVPNDVDDQCRTVS